MGQQATNHSVDAEGQRCLLVLLGVVLSCGFGGEGALARADEAPRDVASSAAPLSLDDVFTRIDRFHPLLQGAGTERQAAKGQLLQALGAFEPSLVNDLEIERFIRRGATETDTAGFNDVFLEGRHPSGIRAMAGIRQSIGDATIPDLGFNEDKQQVLLGAVVPLLRGFLVNPERAALERARLAEPRAEVEIARTRQDLFLAAANQYWDWVASLDLADVKRRALDLSTERLDQVRRRAQAGAVAPLDIVEAEQEVQRRTEDMIAARRNVEQASFKLSLFLWEDGLPATPGTDARPVFPPPAPVPAARIVTLDKARAQESRPEVRAIMVEAKLNDLTLEVAENNLLPHLDAEVEPARSPEKFVLGLGYRFGLTFKFPFLQRGARGDVATARAKTERLALALRFRRQQVSMDVDNALSALQRAKERIDVAARALELARALARGERFRFDLGATSVLFVNLRERNAVDAESHWIQARADYQKSLALYQWATGAWGTVPHASSSFRP